MRRIAALAGVVAMVLGTSPVAVLGTAPVANAAPPIVNEASGEATIPLSDLGGSSSVAFYVHRNNTMTSMDFPVPRGLDPVSLRAKVEIPINLKFANLSVTQGSRTIARLNLPTQDQGEIVIPMENVEVSAGWVSLSLGLSAIPMDEYCWDDDAPIRLVDAAVTFTGVVTKPTSVADFLPAVLRKVTLAIPPKPTPAESDAVVQAAASVARRNGESIEIEVVPLPAGKTALDAPAPPLERQIVIKEGGPAGLSLRGEGIPSLLISGVGKDLADQARLLISDALPYAASAQAAAEDLPEVDYLGDKTTVADLTRGGMLSNDSSWARTGMQDAIWPEVGIDLDQTRFGQPLKGFRVHLRGSHTPVPRDFGGEVIATVSGKIIDRWAVTPDGVFDRMLTIPDKLVKRGVSLVVNVRTTGDPGHCGDFLPMTLRIDGDSTITAVPANPPIPQGFQAFPQALMPLVQFGIGPDIFADTVRAARIAVGLARISGVPLTTTVTTLADALASGGSAVLISPNGWNDPSITLPFNNAGGTLDIAGVNPEGNPVTLNLKPEVKFASLQTVFDGQRSLLIASSNGAPAQLDDLLRFVSGRWGGLDGRALVAAPGADPLTVPNPPVVEAEQPQTREEGVFWWVAGGIAALAGIGALLILLRARRASGPSTAP